MKLFRTALIITVLFWLASCVQTSTSPGYARGGDYIVLGLGDVERNATGAVALTADDLAITLTDANAVDHTLRARYAFKSYIDYSAWARAGALNGTAEEVHL